MHKTIRIFAIMSIIAVGISSVQSQDKGESDICKKRALEETLSNKKKYQEMIFTMINKVSNPDDFNAGLFVWSKSHSHHKERITMYEKYIHDATKESLDTIAFGDSLLDAPRSAFTAVQNTSNFSIGGSWAHHMEEMVKDIHSILAKTNKNYFVKNVIIGSLGGNPLLHRQDVDYTIKRSLETLDTVRKLFPTQRIIVYGIPPTVSIDADKNALKFEAKIFRWVIQDYNSVFLPLQKKFAGEIWLFPKNLMTSDGIHFTPLGVCEFDLLLERGKKAKPRNIVD